MRNHSQMPHARDQRNKATTEPHCESHSGGTSAKREPQTSAGLIDSYYLPSQSAGAEEANQRAIYNAKAWILGKIRRLQVKPVSCSNASIIGQNSRELARLNEYIEKEQSGLLEKEHNCLQRYSLLNSAYIQFNRQIGAHMACQTVVYHTPRQMIPTLCEVLPGDIIWGNMALSWWQELARTAAVILILTVMIVLWAIPVAWSAALGQLSNLIEGQGWLSFLRRSAVAEYVAKALAGILPAVVLELLLFAVPLILKGLARVKGAKTTRQETQFIQTVYFIFLFMQVFLVTSIASFFTVTIGEYLNNLKELQTVESVLSLLARNLPKAANYFFCYMILQALATSSGTLLQVGRLVSWFVIAPLRDITPRQKWARRNRVDRVNWGSFFPVYTNFACIGLIYCVIAPLISVWAIITFSLLWLAHSYSIIYVSCFETDTGGILYPSAINQTFTGLYVMELCLAGMFFGVVDGQGKHSCIVHGFFMIGTLVLTAAYQIVLNSSFSLLFKYMPIDTFGEDLHESAPVVAGSSEQEEIGAARCSREASEITGNTFEPCALRAERPTVWVPDWKWCQTSGCDILDTNTMGGKAQFPAIRVSSEGASLDVKGRVAVTGSPPPGQPADLTRSMAY
ncbi:hypothetical protein V8C42DRAFT_338078 [Trichoderma barbatum]